MYGTSGRANNTQVAPMTYLRDPYVHPFGPNPIRWDGSLQPWAPVAYKISLF